MDMWIKGICYVDGEPCDCGVIDVIYDCCLRDEYVHEEDQDYSDCDEMIEAEYHSQSRSNEDGDQDVWR